MQLFKEAERFLNYLEGLKSTSLIFSTLILLILSPRAIKLQLPVVPVSFIRHMQFKLNQTGNICRYSWLTFTLFVLIMHSWSPGQSESLEQC